MYHLIVFSEILQFSPPRAKHRQPRLGSVAAAPDLKPFQQLGVSPGVDAVGAAGPPEEAPQVLADALPEDLAGALALLAAAHHKLVQVGSGTAHWFLGDDGRRAVARGHESRSKVRVMGFGQCCPRSASAASQSSSSGRDPLPCMFRSSNTPG